LEPNINQIIIIEAVHAGLDVHVARHNYTIIM